MTGLRVPRFEPEVIAAAARRYYGNAEKVATTAVTQLIVHGVTLSSRYNKAHEFDDMARMVECLGPYMQRRVKSIWCDSKCTACYDVQMNGPISEHVAKMIGRQMTEATGGHNGISIRFGDDCFDIYPWWPEP